MATLMTTTTDFCVATCISVGGTGDDTSGDGPGAGWTGQSAAISPEIILGAAPGSIAVAWTVEHDGTFIWCCAGVAFGSTGTALTFTSANAASFPAGAQVTFQVTTTGGVTPPTLSYTGTLPPEVTFTDNGNGTATLAGLALLDSVGTYDLVFVADDGTPTITDVEGLTVLGSLQLTITGSGFGGTEGSVTWAGQDGTVVSWSDTVIVVGSFANDFADGDVIVTTAGDVVSNSFPFDNSK